MSSTIFKKRQIITHGYDIDEDYGGDVDGVDSTGWGTANSQHNGSPKRSRR